MARQGGLRMERRWQVAQVSRAGFSRSRREAQPVEAERAGRAEMHPIAREHRRRDGDRRITAEWRRRGLLVHHTRVARLMREDTRLAVQPRAFVVTTDAQHDLAVYRNLASRLTLPGINQLWVAASTYLRRRAAFVDLAGIVDGFARKVGGWALEKTLATRWPRGALHQAITARPPPPGVGHHSDRGIPYASGDDGQLLQQHPLISSMSRPANPYATASGESFLNTRKREEIYATTYRDLVHLRATREVFLDQYDTAPGATRRGAPARRRSSRAPWLQ